MNRGNNNIKQLERQVEDIAEHIERLCKSYEESTETITLRQVDAEEEAKQKARQRGTIITSITYDHNWVTTFESSTRNQDNQIPA